MLVYIAIAFAVTTILRRGDEQGVVAGTLLGISFVCMYALATWLLPDLVSTAYDPALAHLIAQPLGYPNSLGLLAAMGLVLAVALCTVSRSPRAIAGAGFTAPILSTTLYFTFSRGAWAALLLGLAFMLTLTQARRNTLWSGFLIAAPSTVCVALASRQSALTTEGATIAQVSREGRRLALALLVACFLSALLARLARRPGAEAFARRVSGGPALTRLVCLLVAGLTVAFVVAEGSTRATDLPHQLAKIQTTGRTEPWAVAWAAFKSRPIAGHGAGSFEYLWYEGRPTLRTLRDAHSLYLEMLAELGVVGLALLVGAIGVPLAASVRGRDSPLVPGAAAAFVAWAAASSVDWQWEMVGVTTSALLAGAVGLIAVERGGSRPLRMSTCVVGTGVGAALSVAAVVTFVGNQALFAGKEAVARKDWVEARQHANRARALLPWSYEPYLVLGDTAAGLGSRPDAIRFYRDAVSKDRNNWVAWLRLAQVAHGAERARAYAEIRKLNPREENLPFR